MNRLDVSWKKLNHSIMVNHEKAIDDFFNRYAARFNRALWNESLDVDGTVQSFADEFISASPFGVRAGKNDQTFREAILDSWNFYRNLGIHSMIILKKKIDFLDEFQAMTRIKWQSLITGRDDQKDEMELEFEVIYLTQTRNESIKIFAYITGNEEQVLKDVGLL